MSKWNRTTLGEVVSESNGLIQTGPFGSQLHASDYVENGIPCIMPTNMKENRVSLTGIARISDKDAQRLSQHLVKSGDIVYSRRGDITQKALISDAENGFFCGTGCILIRPGGNVDSRFLTYFLSTKESKEWLINHAVGITMPNLNTKILFKLPLRLPSRDHQERIAAVLSSIDQKIEINNRINAELEAMAKTLYDYWFVQFDFPFDFAQGAPDDNGKPYKSSGGKMVYSKELKREIPAGWEVLNLKNLVDLVKGNVSPSEVDRNIPYVGLEHISRKNIVLSAWSTPENISSEKTKFKKNDILFGKIRPYFHKVAVALFDGITSTDTIVLRAKRANYFGLALETVFSEKFIEAATQASTGSKMPRADWNVLQSYKVAMPNNDLLETYQNIFDRALRKIELSVMENQQLTALRDWLLPMLMNGQVQVTDTNHLKTAETQHSADNSLA